MGIFVHILSSRKYMINKVKNVWKRMISNIDIRTEMKKKYNCTKNNDIVIIDTAINSNNLGDEIIMYYVEHGLKEMISFDQCYHVASHSYPSEQDIEKMQQAKYVIVCGTNILSPQMELYSGWKFDKKMIHLDNVILVGVGWWGYKLPSMYSKFVYRNILSKTAIHSTRDEETAAMLQSIGINNVMNTNCLTMWGLDEICRFVPNKKCDRVVFTVTAVMHDPESDKLMVRILQEKYKELYFWPQGETDLEYLKNICDTSSITILDRTLKAYTDLLSAENIDYVGSRLHGGIHALHHNRRTIIIAVDNRAAEMSRDTNLPVIKSEEIASQLPKMIDSEWKTEITLNRQTAEQWKNALKERLAEG